MEQCTSASHLTICKIGLHNKGIDMKYYKGIDISTLIEVESCGGRYYDESGKETELFDYMSTKGINAVRVRLWNNPYDEHGNPYGAGTNDLKTAIELMKRAKAHNMDVLLDYHYSDFWADPGKQFVPKAWRGHSLDELIDDVYEYTFKTLTALKAAGLLPELVQVGNELSNGLLWPVAKVPEYENIAKIVSAGIKAVREVSPDSIVMIHLDNGGNNELYRRWFDNYIANNGADFDVIGLSYYPFWHGDFKALWNNMSDIAVRYHKDLIIAEVSMGFTMDDYATYEGFNATDATTARGDKDPVRKGYATRPSLIDGLDYPMTIKGQSEFMQYLLDMLKRLPEDRGRGFFYWEAGWIPVKGSGWATPESCAYIEDPGPCGNEWANQALFDYDGHALPAWNVIRDFEP